MIYLDELLEDVMMKVRALHRQQHGILRDECLAINEQNCGVFRSAERRVASALQETLKAL